LWFVLLLNEGENVKFPDLAIGEEAVHGVLFVIEHLKYGTELGQNQQLDGTFAQVENLEGSSGFF
jgi:hypothetical protein